ncbi:hypothetical protein BSKO_08519 [Bryopsis sp. KO-2023]|nr:hypothetical protein BSKO_08519 [Bryopsis sp. KO-2023]
MPKSRNRPQLHFSVSPWMSKKQKLNGTSETEATPCYEEVFIDLDPKRQREGKTPSQTPSPRLDKATSQSETVDSPECVAEPHLRGGVASEWMTKPSNPEEMEHHWEKSFSKPGNLLCSDSNDGASSDDATVEPETMEMIGECHLVFLDSGHLTGRFIEHGISRKPTFGIIGRELLSKSDCMRDDDWKLLRLTFINFNPRRELTTFVEKKGGDSAILSPVDSLQPDEMTGLSQEDQRLLLKEKKVEVWFGCSVIKCDSDAQGYVRRFHPKLAGKDVLVNIGELRVVNMDRNFANECSDVDGF